MEYGVPVIRIATADDLDALVALNAHVHAIHVEAHPERYKATEAGAVRGWFEAQLRDEACTLFVAALDGVDVGYLRGVLHEFLDNPFGHARLEYEVDQLAVAPAGRRRGVGRALMRAAEDHARGRGCVRVGLNVVSFNTGAQAFYEALGYEPLLVRMTRELA